jgi:hypothetical protein
MEKHGRGTQPLTREGRASRFELCRKQSVWLRGEWFFLCMLRWVSERNGG